MGHDLLVRGATVVDGSGRPGFRADVAVDDGRITAVGRVTEKGAEEIDAAGAVVTPGFVDVHTHYDGQVTWDPLLTPSIWHGVTTVVMGNCGFTLAPCRPSDRHTIMRLLSFVEGMPLDTLQAAIPWQWESYPQYLDALEQGGLGVNVASFIGHSAIRLHVMGASALEREATSEERAQMAALVREGVAAGAIGWSTSFAPTHFFADDDKPAPSRVAAREELLELAAVMQQFDRGIIELAPKLIVGSTDDKLAEIASYAELARVSGKTVVWAPLLHTTFVPDQAEACLAEAERLQTSGVKVVPQVGCRPLELRFDFAKAGFGLDNNPFWRPIMQKPREERLRLFRDPAFREELSGVSRGFVAALAREWDQIVLRLPQSERTAKLQDRSVASIASERGVPPVDAFCDVVLEGDLQDQWGALVMNYDEERITPMLRHPAAVIALSDAGAHMDTLCDQGFTTYLLGHWVREQRRLSLEEAVRMVTSKPADRYGLAGRGRLAPGAAGDVVIFDPARIGTRQTELVCDLPEGQRRLLQKADGIEWVFVNGVAVVEDGTPSERLPGRLLRGGH
jgi:N-acyl-D-aspartate/D-glutamate deacylase